MLNRSFEIYRKLSLLYSKGIHISDILWYMGIKDVYVYGIGEMGRIVLSDLSGEFFVPMVFDQQADEQNQIIISKKNKDKTKTSVYRYSVFPPSKIPDNSTVILITPAACYHEILIMLQKQGVENKRLLSLNLLLHYGMYFQKELILKVYHQNFSMEEFLIVGGQFSNKGSQSMIFVAVNEIKKRYRDALVWFCPNFYDDEYKNEDKYKILILTDGSDKNSTFYELLPRLKGIVDISGYALASHGRINETKRYMNYLRLAKLFHVPYYIMPQSFGPFDYDEKTKEELKSLLSFVRVIYAREWEGYDLLNNKFNLTNVRYSKDLVLQNKILSLKDIYTDTAISLNVKQDYKLYTENNVAIIPNIQNYRYGNQKDILQLYIDIISLLLSLEKNIYIISHSEDWTVCEDIFKAVQRNERVHLYNNKFDCIGFSTLVRNFQYIIASRYHAVIHAYKENKPCIVIGWAEKYKELLKDFCQERFVFDVRESMDREKILSAVEYMDREYIRESEIITSILPAMQKDNCFDILNIDKIMNGD